MTDYPDDISYFVCATHDQRQILSCADTPTGALAEAMAWTDGNVLDGVVVLPCTIRFFQLFASEGSFSFETTQSGPRKIAYVEHPDEDRR